MRDEDAYEAALRLLRHRDYAVRDLGARLESRGVEQGEVERALERLLGAGLIDDARYAQARASSLASRGAGDELIRRDLERSGISSAHAHLPLAAIEPEHERAGRILSRRGASLRTARYLRSRGFDDELVHALVGNGHEGELG